MPVDLALSAQCGIVNDGKRSTGLSVWCWEKVKIFLYTMLDQKKSNIFKGVIINVFALEVYV